MDSDYYFQYMKIHLFMSQSIIHCFNFCIPCNFIGEGYAEIPFNAIFGCGKAFCHYKVT